MVIEKFSPLINGIGHSFQNRLGPVGRTGWTGNWRGKRFELANGPAMLLNRCEPEWPGQNRWLADFFEPDRVSDGKEKEAEEQKKTKDAEMLFILENIFIFSGLYFHHFNCIFDMITIHIDV